MERTAKIAFVILSITITITIISTILTVHLIPDSWHDSSTAIVLQPILELGLEKQFFTLVHGVVWIGIANGVGRDIYLVDSQDWEDDWTASRRDVLRG